MKGYRQGKTESDCVPEYIYDIDHLDRPGNFVVLNVETREAIKGVIVSCNVKTGEYTTLEPHYDRDENGDYVKINKVEPICVVHFAGAETTKAFWYKKKEEKPLNNGKTP